MRRWLSVLLVAVVLAAALPLMGCGAEEPKESYKVGAVFAVTGFNSPLGTPEKQTVEMMVEQINAKGGINGHPLEVIVYDTASDVTQCVTLVNKLIVQDNVLAVIGPTSTGESMALLDTITSAKIPLISCAAGVTIVTPVNERYWVFKTPQTDVLAVKELYKYIQGKGIQNIAIITDTGGYGSGGKAVLESLASSYGLTIVDKQTFGTSDTDMTSQVTHIKGTNAKAVICWGTNPGPAIIAANMKALAVSIPLFCSHGIANKKFIEVAGDAANGVIFPSGKLLIADQLPKSDPQKAVLLKYTADFDALYGTGTANTFGGHAYDALTMVCMALEKMSEGLSTAQARAFIRDEVEKVTDYAGTGGIFNMSPEDHMGLAEGCFVLIKIEDQAWTWLQ